MTGPSGTAVIWNDEFDPIGLLYSAEDGLQRFTARTTPGRDRVVLDHVVIPRTAREIDLTQYKDYVFGHSRGSIY